MSLLEYTYTSRKGVLFRRRRGGPRDWVIRGSGRVGIAIRYTEPETSVEIGLDVEHGPNTSRVKLVVRVYGPGVSEPERTKIFQPFYRLADARDRESRGADNGVSHRGTGAPH